MWIFKSTYMRKESMEVIKKIMPRFSSKTLLLKSGILFAWQCWRSLSGFPISWLPTVAHEHCGQSFLSALFQWLNLGAVIFPRSDVWGTKFLHRCHVLLPQCTRTFTAASCGPSALERCAECLDTDVAEQTKCHVWFYRSLTRN